MWKVSKPIEIKFFHREFQTFTAEHTVMDEYVKEQCKALKYSLVSATDTVCGSPKGSQWHQLNWMWIKEVRSPVKEKMTF